MNDRCPKCKGSGKITLVLNGTRQYRLARKCKTCAGSGLTVQALKQRLDAANIRHCPTGRWVDGYGPGHQIWKEFDM